MGSGVCSYCRTMGAVSIGALLLLTSAHAGEKIHFTESPEKVDVPKPTTRDDRISSRFAPRSSADAGADVGAAMEMEPSANRTTANPVLSRKLEEYLDKKRNWMFVDPKDKDKFGSEQDLKSDLKSEEESLDPDEKSKTVQEKFYEHPSEKPDAQKKKKTAANEDDADSNSRDNRSDNKPDLQPKALNPELSLGSLLRMAERVDANQRDLNDMSHMRSLGSFAPDPSDAARKAERDRDVKQHDAEFARIIAPRAGGPTVTAVVDPVNTQSDVTRREVNPFAPKSDFGNYNAGEAEGAGQSFLPNLPRPGGSDSFASKLPTAPAFSLAPPVSVEQKLKAR